MKNICVYGAVNDKIDNSFIQAGIELGKYMAKKNYGLVYSGMKGGISGAVARGVATKQGLPIIGIMPEFFRETKKNEIFEGCTEELFAKDISKRKELMKSKADAIIVAPGGIGTFDELFDAICIKRWGLMDKPIIIYNINNYYQKLIEMLDYSIETNFGKENYRETYKVFNNLEDMFDYIEKYNYNQN